MKRLAEIVLLALLLTSCAFGGRGYEEVSHKDLAYAQYFDIKYSESGVYIYSISPYDGRRDSVFLDKAAESVVCFSTTQSAAFCALGQETLVKGVSGVRYLSDTALLALSPAEVGYEGNVEYETILSLEPDLVLAYAVSSSEPEYVGRLRDFGYKVLVLYDHLEFHPLARAEYVKLAGASTGMSALADSLFDAVASRYEDIAESVSEKEPAKVLMNLPYADHWFVPGKDSYMSVLVRDAGGEILNSQEGSASSTMTLERARILSSDADFWLHTANCRSLSSLASMHPLFSSFPVFEEGRVFNNIAKENPNGGNDYWESGALRPDLILEDLANIFHKEGFDADSLHYYIELH